jgi:hypothetical protein
MRTLLRLNDYRPRRCHLVTSLTLLLPLLVASPLRAAPITYRIDWTIVNGDTLADYNLPVATLSPTWFTYDSDSGLFGGFVVEWAFPADVFMFDYGSPLNAYLTASDRAFVASALLTSGSNTWVAYTHSHNEPEIFMGLDPPGFPSPTNVFPLPGEGGPDWSYYFRASGSELARSGGILRYECGDLPAGCSIDGTYRVSRVPEPSALALVFIGLGGLLLLRSSRRFDSARRSAIGPES